MPNPVSSDLPSHPDVEILARDRVWNGRCPLDLVTFRHRRFDGTLSGERRWELWRRGVAMAVLPYDPVADQVVLIEQFRLPALAAGVEPLMLEIPAGFQEPGETATATALRECHEETGLAPDRLEPIGEYVLMPGGCDERIGLHAGRIRIADVRHGSYGLSSEQEETRLCPLPAEQAINLVLAGRLPNSVAALALLWLGLRRPWLQAHWAA